MNTGYVEPDSALELFTATAPGPPPQPSSTQDWTPASPDSFMLTSPPLCELPFSKIRSWDPLLLPPRRFRALSLPRVSSMRRSIVVPSFADVLLYHHGQRGDRLCIPAAGGLRLQVLTELQATQLWCATALRSPARPRRRGAPSLPLRDSRSSPRCLSPAGSPGPGRR